MIIGFIGLIGSGKTTAADYLVDTFGFEPVSFAGPLKDATSLIFNWDREMVEGKTVESREWREKIDPYWTRELGWDVTPRAVLQKMGTEAGRNVFGKNLWVASAMKKVYSDKNNHFVFTDVRFENEIDAITEAGGKIYVVMRGKTPSWFNRIAGLTKPLINEIMPRDYPDIHISEWDWIGNRKIEHEWIFNNGTLDELYEQIDRRISV